MELDADDDHHKFIYLDEAGFNLAKTRRRGWNLIYQRATIQVPGQRGANITMCAAISEDGVVGILDHIMQLSLSTFKLVSRPMRNLPPCIYPHTLPSLTRLRNFSPHGDGRFMIGTLMNKSLYSRPWMTPAMTSQQTSVRPGFLARRFFPRCLVNENIHCDVDENLWPNPHTELMTM